MMLAAVQTVTNADAVWTSGRHNSDVAAQATTRESVHAVSPLVLSVEGDRQYSPHGARRNRRQQTGRRRQVALDASQVRGEHAELSGSAGQQEAAARAETESGDSRRPEGVGCVRPAFTEVTHARIHRPAVSKAAFDVGVDDPLRYPSSA